MNRTPHIVGGGLGTFRKEGQARAEKAAREAAEAEKKAQMSRFRKSLTK